jgi:FkbM family methyltransferase
VLQECRDCRVVSFEPSPNSLPYLERTRAESSHRDRWTVIGAAVAEHSGEHAFTIGSPMDALYDGFRSGDRIAGARTITVPVTTLDETWRELGQPAVSFIKIDVEGAEAGVLNGAEALLGQCHPAVVVEWIAPYLQRFRTPAPELLEIAHRHNYRVFTIPGGAPVDNESALAAQMIDCDNFLLLAA